MEQAETETVFEKRLAIFARILVWVIFFAVLYLLRSFSVLVFLTFVFSYIQAHGVIKLEPFIKARTLRVVVVALALVGVLVGLGSYLIPQVIDQAQIFADNFKGYVVKLDKEILALSEKYPSIKNFIPELVSENVDSQDSNNNVSSLPSSLSVSLLPKLLAMGSEHGSSFGIKEITEILKNIGKPLVAISSSFFLGLLFSFLIVLDLPRLSKSVKDLRNTKIGFVYDEVAGSLESFGKTLGHALEAQLVIALINTCLTAIAIFLFGIATKLAFLSLVVFFCSFIPVAGVFISSIPICLLVLENHGGIQAIFLVGAVIWGIHLIEAYVLNPMIFGDRLHINPVLVLMILTIGGKLFGVWGLLLGVPICTYIFTDAIRYKS